MISATVVTRDCERLIGEVLESLRWCDDVVLIDRGSSDHTFEIAATFPNVRVHRGGPEHISTLLTQAASLARHDWIFAVRRDEVVSPELAHELQELLANVESVYTVPVRSYFNGKWIKRCGWHPNRRIRLYNRKHAHFSNFKGRATIVHDGRTEVDLKHPLLRYPYDTIADFIDRIQICSEMYAEGRKHKQKGSIWKALWRSSKAFWRSYLLRLGILEGYEGLVISKALAHRAFYSQLKLKEQNLDKLPTTLYVADDEPT